MQTELDEAQRIAVRGSEPVLGQSAAAVVAGFDGANRSPIGWAGRRCCWGGSDRLTISGSRSVRMPARAAVTDRALIGAVGEQLLEHTETRPNKVGSSACSPSRSAMNVDGGERCRAACKPCVSTRTCRLLPMISWPASSRPSVRTVRRVARQEQRFSHSGCRCMQAEARGFARSYHKIGTLR